MPEYTSNLNLVKPLDGEPADQEPYNGNMDKIDAAMGVTLCTSSTRPVGAARFVGQQIFETNTKRAYFFDGTTWVVMPRFALIEEIASTSTMWTGMTSQIDSSLLGTIAVPVAPYRRYYRFRAQASFSSNVPQTGTNAVIQRWNLALSQGSSSVDGSNSRTGIVFAPSPSAEVKTAIAFQEGFVQANEAPLLRAWAEQVAPTTVAQRVSASVGGHGSYNNMYVELWPA